MAGGLPTRFHMTRHHSGGVVWLTGLSGAGKTTIATGTVSILQRQGYLASILDGDALRTGLNADLGFTQEDRAENVRRVGEVALLFAEAGFVCFVATISPYRAARAAIRVKAGACFH